MDVTFVYANSPYSIHIARFIQKNAKCLSFIKHKFEKLVTPEEDAIVPRDCSIPYLQVILDGEIDFYWKESYPYTIEGILQMYVDETGEEPQTNQGKTPGPITIASSGIGKSIVKEADKTLHGPDAVSNTFLRMIGDLQRKPMVEEICPCPQKGVRDYDATFRHVVARTREREGWTGPNEDFRKKIIEDARIYSRTNGSNMLTK